MCINYIPPTKVVLEEYFDVDDPGYDWEEEIPPGDKHYATMNARAETVGEKPTYRRAWQHGKLCLVPMLGFFEPCYESGKAERWRFSMADGKPFAVAGIWRAWQEEQGYTFSFSLLTINADSHPLLRRMHKPGDEKRSLVIVPNKDYDAWLGCRDPELARTYFVKQVAERLTGMPMPIPRRG